MTTLLTILSSVLGGGLVAVLGVLIWLERRREPGPMRDLPGDVEDPPGLDEPTNPLPPPRDYLEEAPR
jgi:hypothetical protein